MQEWEQTTEKRGVLPSSSTYFDLFAKLCELENLRQAYEEIANDCAAVDIDRMILEQVEIAGVSTFLQQLRSDLLTRAHKSSSPAQKAFTESSTKHEDLSLFRDYLVLVALRSALTSFSSSNLPLTGPPDKAVAWLVESGGKGLTRVLAETVELPDDSNIDERGLLGAALRAAEDSGFADLLPKIAEGAASSTAPGRQLLSSVLRELALRPIDNMLEHVRRLGVHDGFVHATVARFQNTIFVLADHDSQYDWLLPAAHQRLREEMSRLGIESDPSTMQHLDLAKGKKLRFMDYELRCVVDRNGKSRILQRKLQEDGSEDEEVTAPSAPPLLSRLAFVQRYIQKINFGWIASAIKNPLRTLKSTQVGWRHLPITLYPILGFAVGWRSQPALICLALIPVCNWRSALKLGVSAGQHWKSLLLPAFGIAGAVCLYLLASDIFSNVSGETRARNMPDGFFLGQLNTGSVWDPALLPYGLYVPPHFRHEQGPFPMIVFLHSYGERSKRSIFEAGLPRSIAHRFGAGAPNGKFEFVAFFPIDTTGIWSPDTPEVEQNLKVLDYVVERHHIDPSRVYLTGLWNGGAAVWRMAIRYPERWAALAPVSARYQPSGNEAPRIPSWIFHGAKDNVAPIEQERTFVRQLHEAKADVRYTEYPDKGHVIWQDAYGARELYDWFLTKKRPN
jgi:predicted esterase